MIHCNEADHLQNSPSRRDKRRRRAAFRRPAAVAAVLCLALGATACQAGAKSGNADQYPSQQIRIMVPAAPGGGYDQMGRSVQQALTQSKLVPGNVQVYNVPGAGGTTGLSQFAKQYKGNPHQLMAMGLVLVGSQKTTDAEVKVETGTTPIAELASEYVTVVVKKDSPINSLSDLTDRLKADPKSVAIGGSVTGSIDHVVMATLAESLGITPKDLNYVPYESGGEQTTSLLSGDVGVAVSGVEEFATQLKSGEMRALAVSSPERLPGVNAPTFVEEGYGKELVVANWRGILAPPGLSDQQRDAVVGLVEKMRGTEEWKKILKSRGWDDTFKGGAAFQAFLNDESGRMDKALKSLGLIK